MIDLEELYRRLGGDCKSVLQRIPSEAMVCKFVHKYADDPTYSQLQAAVQAADWETAFCAAHTMKGLAQNLGFERLYRSAAALTEAMRGPKPLTEPALLSAVEEEQRQVLDTVGQLK